MGKLEEYFEGDELAANVWLTKYALKDKSGKILEETPDDMHNRIASEFARMERKFGGENALSQKTIFLQLSIQVNLSPIYLKDVVA